jgi:hypothetical protein
MYPVCKVVLLIPLLIGSLACGLFSARDAPTATVQPSPTMAPTDTPASTATTAATERSFPTETPAPSDTPDALSQSGMGPFAFLIGISKYFNPVGPPVPDWNGVPIIPTATSGQEWTAGQVYSFQAPGKISDAVKFYEAKIPPLGYTSFMAGPSTGSAGTGSNATHDSVLMFTKGSQTLLIYIASYDSDPSHISVVLATQSQ